jgi:hypothetical protein
MTMGDDPLAEKWRSPLQAGDRAPEFTLPAVDREGTVSLADYRGRTALLLGLFRGTYCPFCRRAIVRMGQAATGSIGLSGAPDPSYAEGQRP